MDKNQVIEFLTKKEIDGVKILTMSRKNLFNQFGERLRGIRRKGGVFYLLKLDKKVVLYVIGTVGHCAGVAITDLAELNITYEEVTSLLHEKNIALSNNLTNNKEKEVTLISIRVLNLRLEFQEVEKAYGLLLQNVFYFKDKETLKILSVTINTDK
jgi:hypothetical protein